jgi:hypothetical protein
MIICVSIVILFWLLAKSFVRTQQNILDWHEEKFLQELTLSKNEKAYIQGCIDMSWLELTRPLISLWDPFICRLSFMNFSHEVHDNTVNSKRFAYGSVVYPSRAFELARPVLQEHQIQLPEQPSGNFCFGGLGWDLEQNYLKVYFRYFNFEKLNEEWKKLVNSNRECEKQGIIAWTFNKDHVLCETKVYRYPRHVNITSMFTTSRGEVLQHDQAPNESSSNWNGKLNQKGWDIIDTYKKNNYEVDTVAYKDRDHFTLYFPMIQ